MPRTLFQPPPVWPVTFEFAFRAPGPDGWPGDRAPMEATGLRPFEPCPSDFLTEWCTETLTVYPGPLSLPRLPSDEEVGACLVENDFRCVLYDPVLPGPDGWIEARGCNGVGCSDWSNAIAVPEPPFSVVVALWLVLVVLAAVVTRDR